jgi:hypothetical protein
LCECGCVSLACRRSCVSLLSLLLVSMLSLCRRSCVSLLSLLRTCLLPPCLLASSPLSLCVVSYSSMATCALTSSSRCLLALPPLSLSSSLSILLSLYRALCLQGPLVPRCLLDQDDRQVLGPRPCQVISLSPSLSSLSLLSLSSHGRTTPRGAAPASSLLR